jgi:chromosome segregation ATPase
VSKRLSELLTLPGAAPLGDSLNQLRATCAELDEFVHTLIDEMVALQDELDLRRQQLSDAWKELETVKQTAATSASGVSDAQLLAQVTALQTERDELHSELSATNERMTKLANVAVGVAESKAETASVKSELSATKDELTSLRAELSRERQRATAGASEVEKQLRVQLDELTRERSLIEVQLESVRERAAELAAQLDDQQRHFSNEQQRWHSQLGDLTRVMAVSSRNTQVPGDTTAESVRQSSLPTRRTAPATPTPRPETEAPSGNPMIDSVMAQFQMVQREAARRRAKAS